MLSCYCSLMEQFQIKTLMMSFPRKPLHQAIPNQNLLEAARLSCYNAIVFLSTRQARPRMKGLQSETDGATACKTPQRRTTPVHILLYNPDHIPNDLLPLTSFGRVCHRMSRDCTERVTRYGLKSGEKKKHAMTLPRGRALSKTIRGACGLCGTGCQEIALSA